MKLMLRGNCKTGIWDDDWKTAYWERMLWGLIVTQTEAFKNFLVFRASKFQFIKGLAQLLNATGLCIV